MGVGGGGGGGDEYTKKVKMQPRRLQAINQLIAVYYSEHVGVTSNLVTTCLQTSLLSVLQPFILNTKSPIHYIRDIFRSLNLE